MNTKVAIGVVRQQQKEGAIYRYNKTKGMRWLKFVTANLSGENTMNIKEKFDREDLIKRSRTFAKMFGNVLSNVRDHFFDRF